ncbi:hypothetical protein MMC34_004404 [Xylographa carneopallida]|nr:hypothetical protein [Xylographa carneopallida]
MCTYADAAYSQNSWAFPPDVAAKSLDKVTFQVGTKVQLEWNTNYVNESLWLWQSNKGIVDYDVIINEKFASDIGTRLNWTVGTSSDLSVANVFHLCLYNADNPNENFNTMDFYITSNISVSSTTVAQPTPSVLTIFAPTRTVVTDIASTAASSSALSTAATTPICACSTDLPRAVIIALGVGVGCGAPLLFLAGFLAGWQIRTRNSRTDASLASTSSKGSLTQLDHSQSHRNATERPRIVLIPRPASVLQDDRNRFERDRQELRRSAVRKAP